MLPCLKQRNCQSTDHCRHLWLKTARYCRKSSQFDNGTNFTKRFVCQEVIYLPSQDFEVDFKVDFNVDLEFGFSSHPMQGNPRRSWILDSTLWISGFQYWSPHFFKIGTWISDSNRLWVFGFIELDSGFQSPGFRITQTNLFRIPDSSSKSFHPYMG